MVVYDKGSKGVRLWGIVDMMLLMVALGIGMTVVLIVKVVTVATLIKLSGL